MPINKSLTWVRKHLRKAYKTCREIQLILMCTHPQWTRKEINNIRYYVFNHFNVSNIDNNNQPTLSLPDWIIFYRFPTHSRSDDSFKLISRPPTHPFSRQNFVERGFRRVPGSHVLFYWLIMNVDFPEKHAQDQHALHFIVLVLPAVVTLEVTSCRRTPSGLHPVARLLTAMKQVYMSRVRIRKVLVHVKIRGRRRRGREKRN